MHINSICFFVFGKHAELDTVYLILFKQINGYCNIDKMTTCNDFVIDKLVCRCT